MTLRRRLGDGRLGRPDRNDRSRDRPPDRPGRTDPGPSPPDPRGRGQARWLTPSIVHDPDRPAPVVACLERTRSSVLNVLVVVGAGIAASGWVLGHHDPDAALPWGLLKTRQVALGVLVGLVAVAYAILRIIAGRDALRDPARRASKFYKGRVPRRASPPWPSRSASPTAGSLTPASKPLPPSGSPPSPSASSPCPEARNWTTSTSRCRKDKARDIAWVVGSVESRDGRQDDRRAADFGHECNQFPDRRLFAKRGHVVIIQCL